MCGIVGYVGPRQAAGVLLEGLAHLEYRGYDSAGLAVLGPEGIRRCRSVGKLRNLQEALRDAPLSGQIGIGHTRWATHGCVSESNAHPHTDADGMLALIHNGIVENYVALKAGLLAEGCVFASQTDSEVIALLISRHYQQGAVPLLEAVRAALRQIEGSNVIIVLSALEPDRLVAARAGNAGGLVVGLGDGEMLVASDATAILEYTQRVIFLGDRELAMVTATGVECFDMESRIVTKSPTTLSWNPLMAAKGGYKHFMLKEIMEQPRSLADAVAGRVDLDRGTVVLPDLDPLRPVWPHLRRLHAVGCGTAWHACLIAKYLIEDLARIPVEVDYGSEFRYREPLLAPGSVVLVITQSGETADTLGAMQTALDRGMQSVALVNAVGSQAARLADGVVYLNAGPEIGVASTKAFTSQVVVAYLLAIYLGQVRGALDEPRRRALLQAASELPNLVGGMLAGGNDFAGIAERYSSSQDVLYLGRGINYPAALEGALKLKEISYIHAEGYPAGEMKHGPIALIDDKLPVVAICTRDRVRDKMLSNIEQVVARGGRVIAVAEEGDDQVADKASDVLWVPHCSAHLAPIMVSIPLQLLAYHIALRRGCDVDQPRNLAKSVTVE